MSDCPNKTLVAKGSMSCSILRASSGLQIIPGPGFAHHPCMVCKTQWINDEPPTLSQPTELLQLVEFAIREANEKDENPFKAFRAVLDSYEEKAKQEGVAPSMLEKVRSYKNAMLEYMMSGLNEVDEVEYERRLSLCKANTCGKYNAQKNVCDSCGCRLEGSNGFVSKVRLPHEACPVGLWGGIKHEDGIPILEYTQIKAKRESV